MKNVSVHGVAVTDGNIAEYFNVDPGIGIPIRINSVWCPGRREHNIVFPALTGGSVGGKCRTFENSGGSL